MRLGSKIFLTSALVIIVLAGVGGLSLLAVDRLVSVNREITTRAVPALRLTASAREAMSPLVWLEARAAVLGDPRYVTAWTERAARVSQDLVRLTEYTHSHWEALHLREASVALSLKTIGGFSVREIARAFLADEAAIAQRLVRAKRQIRDQQLTLDLPAGPDLAARLDSAVM